MKDEALKIYCAMLAAGQQQGPRLMADAMDQAEKFNREFDSRMEKAREEGRSIEFVPDMARPPRPFVAPIASAPVGTGGIIRSKKVICSECGGEGILP